MTNRVASIYSSCNNWNCLTIIPVCLNAHVFYNLCDYFAHEIQSIVCEIKKGYFHKRFFTNNYNKKVNCFENSENVLKCIELDKL